MRVLVCGGRNADPSDIWNWLESFGHQDAAEALRLPGRARIAAIMHGGARGADEGAGQWAKSEGLPTLCFHADWKKHGKAAGPIRNRRMLEQGRPDVVIAFSGGAGTRDMTRQAEAAGVPVVKVDLTPSAPLSGEG